MKTQFFIPPYFTHFFSYIKCTRCSHKNSNIGVKYAEQFFTFIYSHSVQHTFKQTLTLRSTKKKTYHSQYPLFTILKNLIRSYIQYMYKNDLVSIYVVTQIHLLSVSLQFWTR